jgi:beta-glucosidase
MDTNVKNLVEQMTLEEKAALCTGVNAWQTVAVERLGIPTMTVSDGPHGVRRARDLAVMMSGTLPATCFPTASALAATWDRDLLYALGQALADECIALRVDVILGPGNNMKRTPLCGRNFEYFSEDPFLGGELATRLIDGVQGKGVGTSLKHFTANNQEYQRHSIDAQVDERALREIYLAGFERAVKQAKPWTVMCAYNRLNGPYCSQHRRLLTDILVGEWDYEGFVVSDWGAVHDRVAALEAGLALEMPGPQPDRVQQVIEAVQAGELDESVLDAAVERLLKVISRSTEVKKGHTEIEVDAHHALARRIAGEAMVLLKNEGQLLPLSKELGKLAVIGAAAQEPYFQGGGSSHINPTRVDVPLDELRALAGKTELVYAPGYTMRPGFDRSLIDEAVAVARDADAAVLYIALPSFKESEGYDRADMDLTDQEVALIQAIAAVQQKTVVVLNNGSAVTMGEWIDAVPAVLEAWMMGQAGGGAIADVLYGAVNPSGKLAETFPRRLQDTPAYLNYPGENGAVRYGEGLFIGYRYYDAREMDVLFPFGYGLSYTTFAYGNLKVSAPTFTDVDGLRVSVDVTNTGDVPGSEIVQVYVHDQHARLVRPYKELKGFAKVRLEPGETQTVTVDLDRRAFAYYDPAYGDWVAESGAFDILVGRSSADICLQETVQLESSQVLPSMLHRESTLGEWLDDPRGAAVLQPVLQQMMAHMGAGEEAGSYAMGLGAIDLMRGLPLRAILRFAGDRLPMHPRQLIDSLLAQVHAKDE